MNDKDIEILDLPNSDIEELEINNNNSFSIINNYGEDLTSKQYITNPAIHIQKYLHQKMDMDCKMKMQKDG